MKAMRCLAAAGLLFWSAPAAAEPPRVVATIGPLHSLTAAVMTGAGTPTLLVPGGASPHAYSLKPSEARALQQADLVVWVGPALERFLADGLTSLAPDARLVEALEVPGITLREGGHEHEHSEHEHEHGEPAHGEPAPGEPEPGHGDAHDHATVDPHVWLDPDNAAAIVTAVAEALAARDPERAGLYRDNAQATRARLASLEKELRGALAPVAGKPFVVFHDAYGYFEAAFGLNDVGAVTVNPEQPPSPRRVAELRERIRELGALCLFREPQFAPRLIETLAEGSGARVGVLDPLGADLGPGPEAYFELLRRLADELLACLGREG